MEVSNKVADRISFAIGLIFIGTVFLLGNLGYITIKSVISFLLDFWPLFIVISGIKLIIGTLKSGSVINLIIDITVDIIIVLILVLTTSGNFESYRSKDGWWSNYVEKPTIVKIDESFKVTNTKYPLEEVDSVKYTIDISFGDLIVKPVTSDNYFEATGTYPKKLVTPDLNTSLVDRVLAIHFRQNDGSRHVFAPWYWGDTQSNLEISEVDTPSTLSLNIGAGDGDIDLSGLNITDANIDLGAGNLQITMDSIPTDGLKLNVGAGDLNLSLPKEVMFEMKYSVGAGNLGYSEDGKESKSFGGLGSDGSLRRGSGEDLPLLEISIGAGNVTLYFE